MGKIGDNIIKAYYRQSKPNSCTRFDVSKVKDKYIAVSVALTKELRRDNNLRIMGKEKTDVGLLLLATHVDQLKHKEVITKDICKTFAGNRCNIAGGNNTSSHFGSTGKIYGVGLVAKYSCNGDVSFGEYSTKGKESKEKKENEKIMNRVTTNCMQNAIDSLQRKMPYSATWFLMVARVTRERIMNYSKLKDMKVNRENLRSYLSCQLNINATTRYSHTERDRTYTIIHVPEQSECNGDYYFHFHMSDSDCLQIQLDEGDYCLFFVLTYT